MPDTLTIMQVCGSAGPGGAESFYLRLVRALHEHSEVDVIPVVRRASWLDDRLDDLRIPRHTAPFGGKLDLVTSYKLKSIIRNTKPDAIQTWMNRASSFLPKTDIPSAGRLGGYYDLKYYRKLKHLIGNTQDLCRYMREEGWPEDKVHYIPNFVDLPKEGFKSAMTSERERLGIPMDATVLLVAGRLHVNKAFDVAIRALAHLPNHVHLLVAGSGDEQENLEALALETGVNGRIHWAGWVNHISPMCAAADIFLVPSRIEPLGNVVLEGWAHAMPVVASDAVGPNHLITNDIDGLITPMEDDKALAAAIQRVVDNPSLAHRLAEAGLHTLRQHFSEGSVVQRYLDFYREIRKD